MLKQWSKEFEQRHKISHGWKKDLPRSHRLLNENPPVSVVGHLFMGCWLEVSGIAHKDKILPRKLVFHQS